MLECSESCSPTFLCYRKLFRILYRCSYQYVTLAALFEV
jgi:hypothetical protein